MVLGVGNSHGPEPPTQALTSSQSPVKRAEALRFRGWMMVKPQSNLRANRAAHSHEDLVCWYRAISKKRISDI